MAPPTRQRCGCRVDELLAAHQEPIGTLSQGGREDVVGFHGPPVPANGRPVTRRVGWARTSSIRSRRIHDMRRSVHDMLTDLVAQHEPSLGPAEQRVAAFLVAEPHRVGHLSAARIAEEVGTSDATVIRTARTLGFRGLPQLREYIAEELAPAWRPRVDPGTGGRRRSSTSSLLDERIDAVTHLSDRSMSPRSTNGSPRSPRPTASSRPGSGRRRTWSATSPISCDAVGARTLRHCERLGPRRRAARHRSRGRGRAAVLRRAHGCGRGGARSRRGQAGPVLLITDDGGRPAAAAGDIRAARGPGYARSDGEPRGDDRRARGAHRRAGRRATRPRADRSLRDLQALRTSIGR